MRRIPFLLLFLATIALTSLYVTAQDPPASTGDSQDEQGRDMDGDGDVDERDEILRRLQRHRPNPRAYRPQQGAKRPLDLPSGGKEKGEQEDEDAPETIILWGNQIEADGFVFLIASKTPYGFDSSLPSLKDGLKRAVWQLSRSSEFTIVAIVTPGVHWNDELPTGVAWSQKLRLGTSSSKRSAVAWIDALEDAEPPPHENVYCCVTEAALRTIELAKTSKRSNVAITFLVDDIPKCTWDDTMEEIFEEITAANKGAFRIHVFLNPNEYLESRHGWLPFTISAWREFAAANRGTFTSVE